MSKRSEFSFDIIAEHENGLGRAGVIHTPHGKIETPTFSVVGTYGEVQKISWDKLRKIGAQVVLSNGYHLSKIADEIDSSGGIAEHFGWNGPTITDSGGYQTLSFNDGDKVSMDEKEVATDDSGPSVDNDYFVKITDKGAYFKDNKSTKEILFTPEFAMEYEHKIGADIIMAFDQLTDIKNTYEYNVEALERTRKWAIRCLKKHQELTNKRDERPYQALYGVLQGAHYPDLRIKAAKDLGSMDFDGFGLGGAFVKTKLGETLEICCKELPKDKPRHLLGLSKPDDIFAGAENGADTFDCTAPTKEARHGRVYTLDGDIDLKKSPYINDESKLYDECNCLTCQNGYTRAEIRALIKNTDGKKTAKEAEADKRQAQELLTVHNVYFILNLAKQIRQSIIDGTFNEFRDQWLARYYSK